MAGITPSAIGNLWIAAQAAALFLWVWVTLQVPDLLNKWCTIIPLSILGVLLILFGLILSLVSTVSLGRNLTPNPVPKSSAKLVQSGWYQYVRHPIYGGILLVAWGISLPLLHVPSLVAATGLLLFFHIKARYEESHLRKRFPEYDEYSKSTWRFLPKPSKRVF